MRLVLDKINPFDILSGKVVQNEWGTFYFKEAGNNMLNGWYPIYENLHRLNGPAAAWLNGSELFYVDGHHCTHLEFENKVALYNKKQKQIARKEYIVKFIKMCYNKLLRIK